METNWPFVRGIHQSQLQPWCWPKQMIEQTVKLPVIWDMIHMRRRCNALLMLAFCLCLNVLKVEGESSFQFQIASECCALPEVIHNYAKVTLMSFFPAGSVGRALGWTHSGQNVMADILWAFSRAFSFTHLPLEKMDAISQMTFSKCIFMN